ncbi:hypothetical protein GF386_04925 [Candidatus Pacearchaeota archaeon]|nr:hypothetical protein [Candidatus Pacearchaeota archaeon]MBD3283456.1 hypothetical protein [Candidatus Pacearchaeota archaeon]
MVSLLPGVYFRREDPYDLVFIDVGGKITTYDPKQELPEKKSGLSEREINRHYQRDFGCLPMHLGLVRALSTEEDSRHEAAVEFARQKQSKLKSAIATDPSLAQRFRDSESRPTCNRIVRRVPMRVR